MLFANLAKSDDLLRILKMHRTIPEPLSTSKYAMDQLMDCFVKGAEGSYNKDADFDYLSYFFADLSKVCIVSTRASFRFQVTNSVDQHSECRGYFTTPQSSDNDIIPLTKLTVFTEHKSDIRRRGVASTIKNVAFQVDTHPRFLDTEQINIMPYLLLPLMGPEEYSDEDTEGMLEDLQLLPPDKEREKDVDIVKTHLETLLLLTTTREGRDYMRKIQVYPVVRECHLHVDDEEVREACDRVVQMLKRDEEGEGSDTVPAVPEPPQEEDEDEEDQIIEVL